MHKKGKIDAKWSLKKSNVFESFKNRKKKGIVSRWQKSCLKFAHRAHSGNENSKMRFSMSDIFD